MPRCLLLLALLAPCAAALAEVRLTPELLEVEVPTVDGPVVIGRNQDPDATIDPEFSLTSRRCPPFCIQPLIPAPGVTPVGELELIEFLRAGSGLLIDGRTLEYHLRETIPGALSIPYTEVAMRLDELGCSHAGAGWDCSAAREVVLFCNGAWCGQSPTAIRAMLREGYPAARIRYYRGGMQAWKSLGLTTVEGRL
jgi:rhodanese-related sulfurtransferase